MKLIFDARVLTHKSYTGVENYTKYILEHISKKIDIHVVKPKTTNKYLSQRGLRGISPNKLHKIR